MTAVGAPDRRAPREERGRRPARGGAPSANDGQASTEGRIVEAATAQFFERGYHGASMKELAAAAGIRSATLYYYFPSKEDLLVRIMEATLDDLFAEVEEAVANAASPVEQLSAAMRTHIHFHLARHREVFVCDAELRALGPANRAKVVAQRDRYEGVFRRLLGAADASGDLDVAHVELVARALLASCTGVAQWFRPDGPLGEGAVAEIYIELFLRALRPRPDHTPD
jgi:AcrR family transcriptional regulator